MAETLDDFLIFCDWLEDNGENTVLLRRKEPKAMVLSGSGYGDGYGSGSESGSGSGYGDGYGYGYGYGDG